MSRAFVKESDRDEPPAVTPSALPPGVPNRTTPEGVRRLRAELDALRDVKDRGAAEKARLAWLEDRVPTLIETPTPANPQRVVFGATVEISGETDRTLRLVGVDEVDPRAGRISVLSPIAKALLGARVGDSVRIETPGGAEEVEVTAIR